jgi:hypothetical protein
MTPSSVRWLLFYLDDKGETFSMTQVVTHEATIHVVTANKTIINQLGFMFE